MILIDDRSVLDFDHVKQVNIINSLFRKKGQNVE